LKPLMAASTVERRPAAARTDEEKRIVAVREIRSLKEYGTKEEY
jgi:hypothetical protein